MRGVPARIVPDNLKTGVLKPDLYDPKINRAFGEFAAHYGCLVDPARALNLDPPTGWLGEMRASAESAP